MVNREHSKWGAFFVIVVSMVAIMLAFAQCTREPAFPDITTTIPLQ